MACGAASRSGLRKRERLAAAPSAHSMSWDWRLFPQSDMRWICLNPMEKYQAHVSKRSFHLRPQRVVERAQASPPRAALSTLPPQEQAKIWTCFPRNIARAGRKRLGFSLVSKQYLRPSFLDFLDFEKAFVRGIGFASPIKHPSVSSTACLSSLFSARMETVPKYQHT